MTGRWMTDPRQTTAQPPRVSRPHTSPTGDGTRMQTDIALAAKHSWRTRPAGAGRRNIAGGVRHRADTHASAPQCGNPRHHLRRFHRSLQTTRAAVRERKWHKVISSFGASMGNAPDAIPTRLEAASSSTSSSRRSGARRLHQGRRAVAGSRVDLVRLTIGFAVMGGAPKPDISTVPKLKRALLDAKSIAYSGRQRHLLLDATGAEAGYRRAGAAEEQAHPERTGRHRGRAWRRRAGAGNR